MKTLFVLGLRRSATSLIGQGLAAIDVPDSSNASGRRGRQ